MERQMIIDQSCKKATEQTKTTLPQSKDKMTEPETKKEKRKKASLQHHHVTQNTPSGITHSLRLFCCPSLLLSVCCFALVVCRA